MNNLPDFVDPFINPLPDIGKIILATTTTTPDEMIKATPDEMIKANCIYTLTPPMRELVIQRIMELLVRIRSKPELKKMIKDEFGIGYRSYERYHTKALKRIADSGPNKPREELLDEAVNFYQAIIKAPLAKPSEQTKAQGRLDKLYGLDAPQKVTLTDISGASPWTPNSIATIQAQLLIKAQSVAPVTPPETQAE